MAATKKATAEPADQPDTQLETDTTGELFEVLTQGPNGWRTVHRVRASSKGAAEKVVTDRIDDGVSVIGSSVAGCGLGSGDAAK